MKSANWLVLVLAVILLEFLSWRTEALFTPTDNYLIVCGSSQNVTFQGRTFVPDLLLSSLSLKSESTSYVATSNSSVPSSLYQSARIFSGVASYKFNIKQEGRHWIRLYFYPFPKSGHDLLSAPITVVADDFVLLNNFTFENYNGSFLFEYAINVTSATLMLTFIPWNNSVSFVNAIEVVSIPDAVLPDQALALNSSAPVSSLSESALETVYRLNMGGPLITAQNDTLGRTWENDSKYLHVSSSAVNLSVNPASIKYTDSITQETAPNRVYATAVAMGDANVPSMNSKVTWVFPVDSNFRYLVRAHFCDILSQSLNAMVFNLYINDDIAVPSLDLSTLTGKLNLPYYKDFISKSSAESGTLTVSIGPDSAVDITNATLNGLEIMKISNDAGSLDGLSSAANLLPKSLSKKNRIPVIIGSLVGAVAAVALIGFCCCCMPILKSKVTNHGHPMLPLRLPALSPGLPREQVNIAEWAMSWQKKETSSALMEPEDNSMNHIPTIQFTSLEPFDNSVSLINVGNSGIDDDGKDSATSSAFSQLVNPSGR
ncbi:hypothetical protein V6N13_121675 [Hibiscus sabdariffa]